MSAITSDYTGGGAVIAVDAFRPGGAADSGALRTTKKGVLLYDSGAVAAGAVITSPVLDLTGIDAVLVKCINSDGASTRNFTMLEFLDDGVTSVPGSLLLKALAISSTERGALGLGVASSSALQFIMGGPLPTRAQFTMAAAGASSGRVTIWGR